MDYVRKRVLPENGPELSSQTRFHQHVQVLAVLESLEEFYDELTVGLSHDLLLRHDVQLLSRLHDLQH